jgi:hypothetical protein
MNEIKWPAWVGRREQIALDAVVRLIEQVKFDERSPFVKGRQSAFTTALRDVVRVVGFQERNSVGVLADLIEKRTRRTLQRVST